RSKSRNSKIKYVVVRHAKRCEQSKHLRVISSAEHVWKHQCSRIPRRKVNIAKLCAHDSAIGMAEQFERGNPLRRRKREPHGERHNHHKQSWRCLRSLNIGAAFGERKEKVVENDSSDVVNLIRQISAEELGRKKNASKRCL